MTHHCCGLTQDTEEQNKIQEVDQAAKVQVAQVGLGWQHKGGLFIVLLWINCRPSKYHAAAHSLLSSSQPWWDGEEDQI